MSKGSTIFVGKLSSRVHTADIEDQFSRYGRIKDVDYRKYKGFAFIEYSHRDDAKYAIEKMDGRHFEGSRLVVEFKGDNLKRTKKTSGPVQGDVCYNCGQRGHWANECKEGDWKNKCYRCGKSGHVKKDCSASETPKKKYDRSSSSSSRSSSSSSSKSRSRSRSKDKKDKKKTKTKKDQKKSESSRSKTDSNESNKKSGSKSKSSAEK